MPTKDGRIREKDGRHYKYTASRQRWFLQCRGPCARYLDYTAFRSLSPGQYSLKCKGCGDYKDITPVPQKGNPVMPVMKKATLDAVLQRTRQVQEGWLKACLANNTKRLACRTCGGEKSRDNYQHPVYTKEFYRDCVYCREHWKSLRQLAVAPLDAAYLSLYPTLVDYGTKVTGSEILFSPNLYPGPTYFHLTLAQRNAAVALAHRTLALSAKTRRKRACR